MRQPRIKVPAAEAAATYHATSRTVNGEFLFDESDLEMLRKLVWEAADYCGITLLTYALMDNHLHLDAYVPKLSIPTDAELLRRYRVLNPALTRYRVRQLAVVERQLASGAPAAEVWRQRQLAQMGDISQYMKIVKQRFTTWFNKRHKRFGTIWAERFLSVLVENKGNSLVKVSAYIDLNPVRAGLVSDPKDYRFCGYAEAVAGNLAAQRGLMMITETSTWTDAQAAYRLLLYSIGSARSKGRLIPMTEFERVARAGGKLPLPAILRQKAGYLTRGGILGSKEYVAEQIARCRRRFGWRRDREPRPLPPVTDWGGLTALRRVRTSGLY